MNEINGAVVLVANKKVAWFKDINKAEEWSSEYHFGQWFIKDYTVSDKSLILKENIKDDELEIDYLNGVMVIVDNENIAWFEDKERAKEWSEENIINACSIKDYIIANKPLFTEEEIKEHLKNGEEMLKKFVAAKVCKD